MNIISKKQVKEVIYLAALVENRNGKCVKEICNKLNISHSYFYKLRKKYEGVQLEHLLKLKKLKNPVAKRYVKRSRNISDLHFV